MKAELVFAPQASLDEDGLRFRYSGRVGGWNEHDPAALRRYVVEGEDSFYIGYRFSRPHWLAQLYAGATLFADTKFGFRDQVGLSGIAKMVWLGDNAEFIGMHAQLSTLQNVWDVGAVSGWPTGWKGLKAGPEGGIGGNVDGWYVRGGLALTGMELAGLDLALGAGAMLDDQHRAGPYVSVWVAGRF